MANLKKLQQSARHTAGSFLNWFGGGVSRAAATAFATGLFFVVTGVAPAEWVTGFLASPPDWLMSGWTRLIIMFLGFGIITAAFAFNKWSQRQKAIDALAEELSWAIHNLLNSRPPQDAMTDEALKAWEEKYRSWCSKVSNMLEDRAFFTRADQLHFNRLGFIDPVTVTGVKHLDWLLSQLRLKFERLRDIINWAQSRR